MKITKGLLKKLIREEKQKLLTESNWDDPGWEANDQENWENEQRRQNQSEIEQEKKVFLKKISLDWYDEFEVMAIPESTERDIQFIDKALSDCYDLLMTQIIGE